MSVSICLFQLTVLGIAGNHGVVVLNLVEEVPNKEPGLAIMLYVEVQHVQAIALSKRIVTPIVVLVNHISLSDMRNIFLSMYLNMSISVDCSWNSWQSWSSCTKSCGGGTKKKTRTKNDAVCGGAACTGNAVEFLNCNTHCCAGNYCVLFHL